MVIPVKPTNTPRRVLLRLKSLLGCSCALNRRSENVVIKAVIIAELEFSDIERKVLSADLVVAANDAALEDAPKSLNRLGVNRADNILMLGMVNGAVVEFVAKVTIANPLIGAEQTNLVRYGFVDEILQSLLLHISNQARNYVAFATDSADDSRFAGSCRTRLSVTLFPVPVLGLAADECFIDLNDAAKLVHVHLDKGDADAMTHIPSGFVRTETHRPHDLERAHSLLADQHHVSDAIPVPQRLVGVLENGPGDMREAIAGRTTRRAICALPVEAGCQRVDLGVAATRTLDAIGPTAGDKVRRASFLIRESLLKLCDGHLMDRLRALFDRGHGGSSFVGGYNHG